MAGIDTHIVINADNTTDVGNELFRQIMGKNLGFRELSINGLPDTVVSSFRCVCARHVKVQRKLEIRID